MKLKRISMLFAFILTMCFFDLAHCGFRSNEASLGQTPQPDHQIGSSSTSSEIAQPIRVTFDNEDMKKSFPEQYEYVTKILKAVSNFLSKLIKVKRLTIANKFNHTFYFQQKKLCYNKLVPEKDVTHGIENSDLHIYVNPFNRIYLLGSVECYVDEQQQRTTFGEVNINVMNTCDILNCKKDLFSFQQGVSLFLHEIIHILGFNGYSMTYDWKNKQHLKSFVVNKKMTKFLASPIVLNTARKYFDCPSLLGMPTENDEIDFGNHWEKTITGQVALAQLGSEIIKISIFTIALLKDTEFYEDVNENLAFPITWGKSKGCDFVMNTTQTNFAEFNKSKSLLGCSEQGEVEYIDYQNKYIDGYQVISGKSCKNVFFRMNEEDKYIQIFDISVDSKCIEENIVLPGYLQKQDQENLKQQQLKVSCLQFQCLNNNSEIRITFSDYLNDSIVCSTYEAGQKKQVSLGNQYSGEIRCPINFEQFCFSAACKNNCSMNGFCLKGKCTCNEGFSSEDCSQPFALLENSISVKVCSQNNYANPDNVCRASCPDSYFKSQGQCMPCDFSCSKCTGPSSSECTACQFLTYLQETTCVSECKDGYQQDESSKKCEKN